MAKVNKRKADKFWEDRYWVLNDTYVKAITEAEEIIKALIPYAQDSKIVNKQDLQSIDKHCTTIQTAIKFLRTMNAL